MDGWAWDFFQLHVMETDRVNHFLLPSGGDDPYGEPYLAFHRRLDTLVGDLAGRLAPEDFLLLLSDHGFCPVKKEVSLNRYLADRGLLALPAGKGVSDLLSESRAYSLMPGRVYVNLRGREPRGTVERGEYGAVRQELTRALLDLRDPEDGSPVIARVVPGEELYHGPTIDGFPAGPRPPYAPDLVAVPNDGYDLKGNPAVPLFSRTELAGMHTLEDAFILVRDGGPAWEGIPNIIDLAPSIIGRAGLSVPGEMEGRALGF
jgi:predicted AlkP superfamily phosphohydrolase/phosphomutase